MGFYSSASRRLDSLSQPCVSPRTGRQSTEQWRLSTGSGLIGSSRLREATYHVNGEPDEFGFAPVSARVHVHALQATILHLLELRHSKLSFRFRDRAFWLTDVEGKVVSKLKPRQSACVMEIPRTGTSL